VTNNDDPEKSRRILISSPLIPGLDSHWVRRLQMLPGYDPPLPVIGQTVLLLSVAGDLLNSYYINVVNATNPAIPGKKNIIDDSYQELPGDLTTEVSKSIEFLAGDSIKFSTSVGSYLELTKSGAIVLCDAAGNKINLTGGGDITIGGAVQKSIAAVGAPDTRGDTLIAKGWL
jgi:hypothetical protein